MTSPNIVKHAGLITATKRLNLRTAAPLTLWLTGLSGSGKSTLAFAFEQHLVGQQIAVCVLDGDNVRHGLCRNLGFSAEDRSENIRRVAEVAKLMNEAGLTVITSLISPFAADRSMAREIIGDEFFREIHIKTPLAVCEQRDPKGLYIKARSGAIASFTGISAPYEAPVAPDLEIDTSQLSVAGAVTRLQALTA